MNEQERIDAIAEVLRGVGDNNQTAQREAAVIMALAKEIALQIKAKPDRLSDEEVMS